MPTRGHVWWETAARMGEQAEVFWDAGHEFELRYAQGNRGVVEVRNLILEAFLAAEADVLLMVDDDVVPPPANALLSLVEQIGGYAIMGAPCPIVRPGTVVLPNVYLWDEKTRQASIALELAQRRGVQEVAGVGFGCVVLKRAVCAKLKRFKLRTEANRATMGEDLDFCLRARSQGFLVGVNLDVPCEHMLTVHGNALAWAYSDLIERLGKEGSE